MNDLDFKCYKKALMGLVYMAALVLVIFLPTPFSSQRASAQVIYTPTPMEIQTAEQVINAVNSLRVANGLPSLSVHPILMQVAQWEVDALVNGAGGHTRPDNMTLGQQLISLGYPLSGDLSQDGYRSENIVFGPGFTVEDAIRLWSSDDPHLNTMLSPNRSDIGVAVASNLDEWGFTVYYYVLETALQTNSGQMQHNAYPTLTAIANFQAVYSAAATQSVADGLLPQNVAPVIRNTALPDGNVLHRVQYGQTLWSIATVYGTTVERIQAWNNLGDSTDIFVGQTLLVQLKATQPSSPTVTQLSSATPVPTYTPGSISPTSTATLMPISRITTNGENLHRSPQSLLGIILALLSTGAILVATLLRKPNYRS